MNQEQLLNDVKETYKGCLSIMQKKNSDYSKSDTDAFSNFRSSEVIGIPPEKAILVRVLDKIARINNVMSKGQVAVVDESMTDTIDDSINYLAILKSYLKEKQHESIKTQERKG